MRSLAAAGRTVFVSSHLMSEMALTADHLLVIGRGRMIADMPMSELTARYSGDWVEVRSADPASLAADLRSAGAEVTPEPDGTLSVVGLESRRIGELAAEHGRVLHQLRDVTASLEEAYFRLTGESVEYRAAAAVPAGAAS
jgi:ABC-2 type transport system ATP-binding protein